MEPGRGVTTTLPVETTSPEETYAWGAVLAATLRPGDVVALYGDLGAGKTHLARGICVALGVAADEVTSPTFTIVNEYQGTDMTIFHLDAYRVRHVDELFEMGYEDYLFGDALCLVEWPERIEPLLPPGTLRLRLCHAGPSRRRIEAVAPPSRT